jgi:addiction module HigA family antidote
LASAKADRNAGGKRETPFDVEIVDYHRTEIVMTIKREDLHSIEFGDEVTGDRLDHVTPGDVLRREFMEPLGLSARAVAREIEVPVTRITEILKAQRSITAETALRLGRRFGASPEFWLGLQAAHDLEIAREALGWAA